MSIIPPWVKLALLAGAVAVIFALGASWAARYYKVAQLREQVASLELGRKLSLKLLAFKEQIEPAAAAQVAAMGEYFDRLIEEKRSAVPSKRVCSDWTDDQRRGVQRLIQTGPGTARAKARR